MPRRVVTSSVAAATGAALAAAALCALRDLVLAGGGGEVALVVFGLWAIPGLAVGLALGAVAAAWRLTLGERALRRALQRLADDRDLDREVTGALAAAAIAAAGYAALIAMLAGRLVGAVQRAEVGARLLGIAAVVALPLAAAAALPIYRVTRRAAAAVPRGRRLPAALVLLATIALAGVGAAALIALTRLDWRALDLPLYRTVALYAAALGLWVGLLYGLAPGLRLRLRRRGALALAAAAGAALLAILALRAHPTQASALRIANQTGGARVLLAAARSLSDADGDGYSALLGGPDCDDHAAGVHPGAREIPGNGVDDNCLGGDRAATPQRDAEPARPVADAPRWNGNLLVILVDTTRADRLGVAGYRRGGASITPHIDALAARGAYFSHAWAQAPNTARSIPSLMTSRFPSQVHVDRQFKNFPVTGDDNPLLFAALREAGFHTLGFASHYYFQVNPGIRHGFDELDNTGAVGMEKDANEVAAPRIVPRAVRALERMADSEQRFAMFVHLFEPHSSYVRHPGLPNRGSRMSDRYDGEIEFVDQWIGTLLGALEQYGLDRETAVVLIADHGEAFGEHRVTGRKIYYHGRSLYEELLRVPLIIAVPGLAPRRIDTPVMLLDVAPTILSLVGAERPGGFVGRSLAAALAGAELPPRDLFAQLLPAPYWNHRAMAMVTGDGRYELIQRLSPHRQTELYDLVADPHEQHDLSRAEAARTEALRRRLIEWLEVDLPSR